MVSGMLVSLFTMNRIRVIFNLIVSLLIIAQLSVGIISGEWFYPIMLSVWILLWGIAFNLSENWKEMYFKAISLVRTYNGLIDALFEENSRLSEFSNQVMKISDLRENMFLEMILNLEEQGYLNANW